MSFFQTTKATVASCSLAASDQIAPDLTLILYTIEAWVLDHEFYDDVYLVTVTKPQGVGDLIDDEGTLMEEGRFFFDSTEPIAVHTELEVEVTGVGSV
jgi:hypothetical protein